MIFKKTFFFVAVIFSCNYSIAGRLYITPENFTYQLAADSSPYNCSASDDIEKIITEAIALGAPIYNEGLHMACYRIYEWAGYKILYEYSTPCKAVETILKAAITKSHGDYSDTERAWLMRQAFDKILGEPTKMIQPENEPPQKNG